MRINQNLKRELLVNVKHDSRHAFRTIIRHHGIFEMASMASIITSFR